MSDQGEEMVRSATGDLVSHGCGSATPSGPVDDAHQHALLQRARSGDMAAMDALLSSHQDRIFRTALGLLGGDEETAAEVAQQVLISAFRHLHQFRGQSRFSTWLYRMTVNFIKNHHTAENRRRARFVPLEPPGGQSDEAAPRSVADRAASEAPSPHEQASQRQMEALVFQKIEELPEEFRAVLVLRYVEDASYEEIAEALDVPLGTVKSRVNRGRAELRRLMAPYRDASGGGRS